MESNEDIHVDFDVNEESTHEDFTRENKEENISGRNSIEEFTKQIKDDDTEVIEKNPIKTFDDLKILLRVLKKHFSTVCPDCIDVLYDAMLHTATSAFSMARCPSHSQCCDACSGLLRELLLRNIMTGNNCPLSCSNFCSPYSWLCNPCCRPCDPSFITSQCCSCMCRKKISGVCCSKISNQCSRVTTCCSQRKRKSKRSKSSKNCDRYKPKSLLVEKQKYLRKEIRKVRQNIDCLKRNCFACYDEKSIQTNLDKK